MRKYTISLLLLAISISGFTQENNASINDMMDGVEIVMSNKFEKNLIGGPIPIGMVIKNNTKHEISFGLGYPDPWQLSFSLQSPIVKNIYEVPTMIDRRVPIMEIPSGETYECLYFLNRYFDFVSEGVAEISYSFRLSVDIDSKRAKRNYEGKIFVELIKPSSDEELKKEYSYYSNNLKSDDGKLREEAKEALSFLKKSK